MNRVVSIGEMMVEIARAPDGSVRTGFGGDTFNTAAYLSRLGQPTAYLTAFSDDPFSADARALLASEGVDDAACPAGAGRTMGLYAIRTDAKGERSFTYWRDRHGTTTLFAALDVKSGLVIGDCMPRHRAREFLTFLRRIDRAVRKPRDIHLVLDNYATHKTPEVMAWLGKHPRFKLHFTPTSASWMNLVERFFAEITTRRIRRESYSSVDEPETAIYDYLLQHNARPKPFIWTKSAKDILTRERRALDALDEIRGGR